MTDNLSSCPNNWSKKNLLFEIRFLSKFCVSSATQKTAAFLKGLPAQAIVINSVHIRI